MTRSLCIATPFAGLFGTRPEQTRLCGLPFIRSPPSHAASKCHCYGGPVVGQQDCRSCIQLEIGTVVGIIVADIVLTLLIALSVFFFVSRVRKRTRLEAPEIKGKTQTVSMRKKPETESPYQELQGVQEDVYNDLRQFQK